MTVSIPANQTLNRQLRAWIIGGDQKRNNTGACETSIGDRVLGEI